MKRIWQTLLEDAAGRSALWVRVGNVGQGLLIAVAVVLFLDPVEQGVWYALASLMAIASMAELGFGQVVIQVVAHDVAANPVGAGLRRAYFAITMRFALFAGAAYAVVFAVAALGLGLTRKDLGGGAVLAAGVVGGLVMILAPLNSYFEGLLFIPATNRRRVAQIGAYAIGCVGGLSIGWGLWAVPMGLALSFGFGAVLLAVGQSRELTQVRDEGPADVSWRRVFWPLQSRYAASWLSGIFFHSALAPLLLARSGAIEAGKFGLTWAMFQACVAISVVWVTGQSAQFATQVSAGAGHVFHADFWRRFRWSVTVFAGAATAGLVGLAAVQTAVPGIGTRFVSLPVAFLVAAAAGAFLVLQLLYVYARSFREEPFVAVSWISSLLVAGLSYLLAPAWGGAGVAGALLAGQGIVLPWVLFRIRGYTRRLNLPAVSAHLS